MRKMPLLFVLVLAFTITSCGQKSSETGKKSAKKQDKKITVEKYCSYYKDADALLMEKYWPKFKGKKYNEVKDLYAEYRKEEKALCEKHGIKDPLKLSAFFRRYFKKVQEYRENDPDYKKYPEYNEARKVMISYATAEI